MSDIFEIKSVNATLKVGDKEYKFADPRFVQKIMLMKKFNALVDKKSEMDIADYLIAHNALNKEQIKMYLPEVDDDFLDSLGEFSFTALLTKITELTQSTFGAVVEKVEGK